MIRKYHTFWALITNCIGLKGGLNVCFLLLACSPVGVDSEWVESRIAVASISFSARFSHASKKLEVLPSTHTDMC